MRPRILAATFALSLFASAQQDINQVQLKAHEGDAKAQNELGVMYRQGDGVPRDKAESVKWYRRAALQKYPDALYNLGIAYFNGDGVASDELRAYAYLAIAKDAGSTEASEALNQFTQGWRQSKLNLAKSVEADTYNHGVDVPENDTRAYELTREIAETGDMSAQYWTCVFLDQGHGIKKDPVEAFAWCLKSAKQDNPEAVFAIADKYEHGIGTKVDYRQAERWYLKSTSDRSDAALCLAHLYKSGSLRSRDELWPDAVLYFAAKRGNKSAEAEFTRDVDPLDEKKQQKLGRLYKEFSDETMRARTAKY
jgi:TPR repeat protein